MRELALALEDLARTEVVILQMVVPVRLRRVHQVGLLSPHDLAALAREARRVVAHAAPASVWDLADLGRTPLLVPRDPKRGEHVDDHQLRWARRQTLCPVCWDLGQLAQALEVPEAVPGRASDQADVEALGRRIRAMLRTS